MVLGVACYCCLFIDDVGSPPFVRRIDPQSSKILLTEAPMNPQKNRETMVQTMFETYGFQSVHVAVQAVLVLYAQGLLTGVVVDSGDGVTHIIPVFEGYILLYFLFLLSFFFLLSSFFFFFLGSGGLNDEFASCTTHILAYWPCQYCVDEKVRI